MRKRIIAIHGQAGAGKDTFATMLEQALDKRFVLCYQTAFAKEMKEFVAKVTDLPDGYIFGSSELRERPGPSGYSARQALTTLGTEWGRALDPDIWVKLMARSVAECDFSPIIADVRFENEMDWVVKNDGILFVITRKWQPPGKGQPPSTTHASEQVAKNKIWKKFPHRLIENDEGLTELKLFAEQEANRLVGQ